MESEILVLVEGLKDKNRKAVLVDDEAGKTYTIIAIPLSQLNKILDYVADFPAKYEIIDLVSDFCQTHKCYIDYDADEMYCPYAMSRGLEFLESCKIVEKVTFVSERNLDITNIITRSSDLFKQKIKEEEEKEKKENQEKDYFIFLLEKFKRNWIKVIGDLTYFVNENANKKLLFSFLNGYFKIYLLEYNGIRMIKFLRESIGYDDAGDIWYFLHPHCAEKAKIIEQKIKEEEEKINAVKRLITFLKGIIKQLEKQNIEKELLAKYEEIKSEFEKISKQIKVEYKIYHSLKEIDIKTSVEGFLPKEQFNQYLQLNKKLNGKYDQRNKVWKITLSL